MKWGHLCGCTMGVHGPWAFLWTWFLDMTVMASLNFTGTLPSGSGMWEKVQTSEISPWSFYNPNCSPPPHPVPASSFPNQGVTQQQDLPTAHEVHSHKHAWLPSGSGLCCWLCVMMTASWQMDFYMITQFRKVSKKDGQTWALLQLKQENQATHITFNSSHVTFKLLLVDWCEREPLSAASNSKVLFLCLSQTKTHNLHLATWTIKPKSHISLKNVNRKMWPPILSVQQFTFLPAANKQPQTAVLQESTPEQEFKYACTNTQRHLKNTMVQAREGSRLSFNSVWQWFG